MFPFMENLGVLLPIAIVAIVLVVGLRLLSSATKRPAATAQITFPYEANRTPFSPAEASFFRVLEVAVGPEHRVFAKLRMADLLAVRRGLSGSERRSAMNRVDRKHFDFVVCERETLRVVAAVELDDASHAAPSRQKRDDFVERACAAAGLRLARVPVQNAYAKGQLRLAVLGDVDLGGAGGSIGRVGREGP